MKKPPTPWAIFVLILLAFLLWLFLSTPDEEPPLMEVKVVCDQDDSLADSLAVKVQQNPQARKFLVSGECKEQRAVTITNDNITIQGEGRDKTIITGTKTEPVIEVIGARGVILTGFTAKDGKHGILVLEKGKKGANFKIIDVTAQDNEGVGLCVVRSEPIEKPVGQTPSPSSSSRFIVDPSDPCMARPNPDFQPPESTPIDTPYESKPLSSSGILDMLIPKAMAASQPTSCVQTNRACGYRTAGNTWGIFQYGPTVVSFINCGTSDSHETISDNDEGGVALIEGATYCTQNTKLDVTNNTEYGLYADAGSHLFTSNSEIFSSGQIDNFLIENASTVTCSSSTVNLDGQSPRIEDPGRLGSTYDEDC